ncbi:hypothetical protein [Achromobacter spanius]|uniref:hypothetical protein n=1 Tax=Achromobacter spanius TaxID=217203 RepID=UPI003A9194FE
MTNQSNAAQAAAMDYYVISVHHTHRQDRYITIWAPEDCGYRLRLQTSGRYTEARIRKRLGYYNSGCSNIAVPCHVVDAIASDADPKEFDSPLPDGALPRVVMNTRANWKTLIANVFATPQYPVRPEFPGASRKKDSP